MQKVEYMKEISSSDLYTLQQELLSKEEGLNDKIHGLKNDNGRIININNR